MVTEMEQGRAELVLSGNPSLKVFVCFAHTSFTVKVIANLLSRPRREVVHCHSRK